MSTSATITVEGVTFAKVYKHFDGDPKSTLPWLKEFNRRFTAKRGNDPEYKFAQLLRSSSKDGEQYHLDRSEFTGWGVVAFDEVDEADVNYEYILKSDGKVTYKHTIGIL